MTNSDKQTSIEEENRALYLAQAKEQPPEHIDDEILHLARKQAAINADNKTVAMDDGLKSTSGHEKVRDEDGSRLPLQNDKFAWRKLAWPLSSAASILLVVGILVMNHQWYPVAQDEHLADIEQYRERDEQSQASMRKSVQVTQDSPTALFYGAESLASSTEDEALAYSDEPIETPNNVSSLESAALDGEVSSTEFAEAESLALNGPDIMKSEPKVAASSVMEASQYKRQQEQVVKRVSGASFSHQSNGGEIAQMLERESPLLSELVVMFEKALDNNQIFDAQIINQYIIDKYPAFAQVTRKPQATQINRAKQDKESLRLVLANLREKLQQMEPNAEVLIDEHSKDEHSFIEPKQEVNKQEH